MTAPTKQEIREAIEAAAAIPHSDTAWNSSTLEDAISTWALRFIDDTLWDRWTCNDENCPARPDWDKRLSELYEEVTSKAIAECDAIVERHLTRLAETMFSEYPDAPRREPEVAA